MGNEEGEDLLGFTPSSKPITDEEIQKMLRAERLKEQQAVQRIINSKRGEDIPDPLGR